MKNKYVKIFLISIVLVIIIIIPILLYYFKYNPMRIQNFYEINWGIKLPSNLKLIYHNQDKHGFQGDGLRFTVYGISEKFFINAAKRNTKKIMIINGNSSDERDLSIEEFVHNIATELKIPKSEMPVFENYYYWYKLLKYDDTLIILCFPNQNKVYFVEKLV